MKTVVFWTLKWTFFQIFCIQQNLRVINYIYPNIAWAHKVHGLTLRGSMPYQDCPLIPSTVLGLFSVYMFGTVGGAMQMTDW